MPLLGNHTLVSIEPPATPVPPSIDPVPLTPPVQPEGPLPAEPPTPIQPPLTDPPREIPPVPPLTARLPEYRRQEKRVERHAILK